MVSNIDWGSVVDYSFTCLSSVCQSSGWGVLKCPDESLRCCSHMGHTPNCMRHIWSIRVLQSCFSSRCATPFFSKKKGVAICNFMCLILFLWWITRVHPHTPYPSPSPLVLQLGIVPWLFLREGGTSPLSYKHDNQGVNFMNLKVFLNIIVLNLTLSQPWSIEGIKQPNFICFYFFIMYSIYFK